MARATNYKKRKTTVRENKRKTKNTTTVRKTKRKSTIRKKTRANKSRVQKKSVSVRHVIKTLLKHNNYKVPAHLKDIITPSDVRRLFK